MQSHERGWIHIINQRVLKELSKRVLVARINSFHGPRLGSYHDGNLNRSIIFLCRICVYNYNYYYLIQWEIFCFKFRIVNSSKSV